MKKLFLLAALLATVAKAPAEPNLILGSGSNGQISVTNFRGSSTVTNLSGVPLGTVDGTATGELGAKVIVLGSGVITSGTTTIASTARTVTASTLTSSGTFAAGIKSISVTVVGGSFSAVATGTAALTTGQTWTQSFAPDTLPALPYLISGTTSVILTR